MQRYTKAGSYKKRIEMYKAERGKPFYNSFQILMLTGHVPMDLNKSTLIPFGVLNRLIKFLNLVCNCVAPVIHLIVSIRGSRDVDISEDIAFAGINLNGIIVIYLVTINWKKWFELLHDVSKDTEFGKHPDFDKLVKRLNYVSVGFTIYCIAVTMIYGLNTYLASAQCEKMNQEKGWHEICGTLISVWLPFEEVSEVVSGTIFFLQLSSFFFTCFPAGVAFALVFEVAEILISHVDNLKIHLTAAFDVCNKETIRERIRFCVRYHVYIIGLARRLNYLVMYGCGVTSMMAALVFAFMGNQVLNSKPLAAMLFLVGYWLALFFICHAGQRLQDKSCSISDAVYASKWYNADAESMRDVRFIIAKSQTPLCLDALPTGTLDYQLFFLINKTAYSYLTLLSQTTATKNQD